MHVCNQQKEPLMTYEIPSRPWKMVAQDLFTHKKKDYLITVGYYSDFWEIDLLTDTTSQTAIDQAKTHLARYAGANPLGGGGLWGPSLLGFT